MPKLSGEEQPPRHLERYRDPLSDYRPKAYDIVYVERPGELAFCDEIAAFEA